MLKDKKELLKIGHVRLCDVALMYLTWAILKFSPFQAFSQLYASEPANLPSRNVLLLVNCYSYFETEIKYHLSMDPDSPVYFHSILFVCISIYYI